MIMIKYEYLREIRIARKNKQKVALSISINVLHALKLIN